jgi:TonB-dependent SusC/RagA subfamily outer membrane receptor
MHSSLLPTAVSVAVFSALAIGCASGNLGASPENPTLTAEDIRDPNEPIEKVLQRKTPGLLITRADDGSIALQIRGSHSFVGTDAPLYVLDGMPFQPGPGGIVSGVDPHNIASIKVIKGSEAAIYGIQGMNGVIAITTKKPEKRSP